MSLKMKNLKFNTTRRVPLEKPTVKEVTTRAGKAKAPRAVKVVEAPAKAVARPMKAEKSTSVVAVRALPPSRLVNILTPLVERVNVGEFRGRKPRPDIVFTATELQALTQCLEQLREAVGSNAKPTTVAEPEVKAKRMKRSA